MYSYANSAAITNGLAVGFGPVFGRLPADQGPMSALGTLSGTVYISGTTTPVPGALVTATGYINTFTATADLNGNYLLGNICADLYWLQAGAAGYYPSPVAEARLRWSGDVAVHDLYLEEIPPCEPVSNVDFDWTPPTPTVGLPVTFQATAGGTAPISFTWSLGDGTVADGATVVHTYAATGTYAVAVTATNCGTATASVYHDVVVVAPEIVPPAPPAPLPLEPGGVSYGAITITNAGGADLDWSLLEVPAAPWLLEDPVSGILAAGESALVLLTYTAPITTGVYTTTLRISSNDPLRPIVDVPVVLECARPAYTIYLPVVTRGYAP
jgi:PKD repeat protein